jgi:hypothetical protein
MSDEVVRRFHELYYAAADRGGTWRVTTWMGVPVAKCPLDLWAYQEILWQVRPELVIECGTYAGGSALFLAHLCDLLGTGLVLTIDIEPRAIPCHSRLARRLGPSTAPQTVAAVRRFAAGKATWAARRAHRPPPRGPGAPSAAQSRSAPAGGGHRGRGAGPAGGTGAGPRPRRGPAQPRPAAAPAGQTGVRPQSRSEPGQGRAGPPSRGRSTAAQCLERQPQLRRGGPLELLQEGGQ